MRYSEFIQIKGSNIVDDIIKQGFAYVNSKLFFINATIIKDTIIFINSYSDLIVDKYVLEKKGYPYRKRKYSSFTLDRKTLSLIKNDPMPFFQSQSINNVYGGFNREFSSISNSILENKFLNELILLDFLHLPTKFTNQYKKFFVGVHMFRIEPSTFYAGLPSPEGIHQDGHDFVIQHMINKVNIKGGVSSIYSLAEKNIASLTLNFFLDSIYVNDQKVKHDVTSIHLQNKKESGFRDMLIIDFEAI